MIIKSASQSQDDKDSYEIVGLVSSQASRGLGLWTAICLGFANFFGIKCKHYAWKIEKAKNEALEDIIDEAIEKGADSIIDVRFALSGLSVIASGTAIKTKISKDKKDEENIKFCAYCGVKIDKESQFCHKCGQKCADFIEDSK